MSTLATRPNDLTELIENLKAGSGILSKAKVIYPYKDACYCSGLIGRIRLHLAYMPDSFAVLGISQVSMPIIEAITTEIGYRPFCRWRDNDGGLVNFEWSLGDVIQRKRDLLFVGKPELIFL